ncbi:MAG: HD domain-containing protein, partial [Actinomycetota bacterium]
MATVTRVLPWRRGPNRPDSAEIGELLEAFHEHHPKAETELIERAFHLAAEAHTGQSRKSGEPYIRHPVAVATIVARQGIDDVTIAAALLHDAVEDTPVGLKQVETDFGADVARIVDGVTKLERVKYDTKEEQQAATLRKMIVAIASDMRVLIIKLADRLHNLRTVAALPAFKQERTARETLDVYAPLAHRLGMQDMKQQLEDLSFAALHPRRYAEIDQMIHQRAPERDLYLAQVLADVQARLAELGIVAEIVGRPKHLWSIYEKMVVKGRSFDEIFDLVGIRVIVDSVRECYGALGSIHATWRPVQGRFKDYIAMPKFNLYQSLHTTVVGPQGKSLEVQLRTKEMH